MRPSFGVVVSSCLPPPTSLPPALHILGQQSNVRIPFPSVKHPHGDVSSHVLEKGNPRRNHNSKSISRGFRDWIIQGPHYRHFRGSGHPHFRTGWYLSTLLAIAPRMAHGNRHMAPGRMARFPNLRRHLQPSLSLIRVKVPLLSGSGSAHLLVPV